MAFIAREYADDIRRNWDEGFVPEPVDGDGAFRDVVSDLFMDWDDCRHDVIRAYAEAHGHDAPHDVAALEWAVLEIYDVLIETGNETD